MAELLFLYCMFLYSINLFWSATEWIKLVNWHPGYTAMVFFSVLPWHRLFRSDNGNPIHKTGATKTMSHCLVAIKYLIKKYDRIRSYGRSHTLNLPFICPVVKIFLPSNRDNSFLGDIFKPKLCTHFFHKIICFFFFQKQLPTANMKCILVLLFVWRLAHIILCQKRVIWGE